MSNNLKCIYNGEYISKKGSLMFTYKVTGTDEQKKDFIETQAKASQKNPAEWAIVDGCPLFHLNITTELSNGRTGDKTIFIGKSFDGTQYRRSMANINRMAALEERSLEAEAQLLAQLRLGLIKRGNMRPATVAPATPTETPAAVPAQTPAEAIANEINAGVAAAEVGNEELAPTV